MKKFFVTIMVALIVFFGGAHVALAQWDYDDYYDTADYSGTTDIGFFENLLGGMGIFIWVVWCCAAILGLGFGVFRIVMIIHAVRYAPDDQKMLWVLLMVFLPIVDFVYFFTKKKEWDPKNKGEVKKVEVVKEESK